MWNGRPLRIAVIGVGYLGRHHARIYAALPGVELVAVVDVDAQRAQQVAAEYGCAAFSDFKTLIGQVDAASVAVPTALHYPVAAALLEHGVHLLLEKPMAATCKEADDLIALADRRRCVLQVGHVERFNPGVRALRRALKEPRFIECHRMGTFVERGIDVHVIMDLMIHDIDIVLSLIPTAPIEVRAVGVPVLTSHIDIANVRLAFENGAVANLTASRVSNVKLRKLRVFQPEAYFSLDYAKPELTVCRRTPQGSAVRPSVETQKIALDAEEPLRAELAAFVESVVARRQPLVSGRDGRSALALALQIVDQIRDA